MFLVGERCRKSTNLLVEPLSGSMIFSVAQCLMQKRQQDGHNHTGFERLSKADEENGHRKYVDSHDGQFRRLQTCSFT